MSEFVKELNFDCDTFSGMKRDMNFVLQRLIGNMQEKGCQNGTLTLKLDVSLIREFVPNYNPEIPGEVSDETALPGPVEVYEDAEDIVYDDSADDRAEDTQFTDETDLDGAGDGTEITSDFEEDETDTEDDEYGYDEPEEEE